MTTTKTRARRLERPSRTSAKAAFDTNKANCHDMARRIAGRLDMLFAEPKHYGWELTGDQGRVAVLMAELLAAMGDESACHDLGIDY